MANWASRAMSVTLAKSDCTVGVKVGLVTVTAALWLDLSTPVQASACWWCWPLIVGAEVGAGGRHGPPFSRAGGGETGRVGEDSEVLKAGGHRGHREVTLEASRRE